MQRVRAWKFSGYGFVWKWIALAICLQGFLLGSVIAETLVVLNRADDTASLIDLATGKAVATLPTGDEPHEVAISGDGRFAVITNYGKSEKPGKSLTVIDIPKARVVKTIDLGEYSRPHGIQWLYGNQFIVTAEANKAVIAVDVETGEVKKSIETGEEISHMIVLAKDRSRAFVANIGSGSISVLDLNEWKRIRNISTGAGAEGISITPDGTEVWVTNRGDNTITVIDSDSLKIIATHNSKTFPIRSVTTPNGDYVLVTNAQSGDIAVFDTRYKKFYGRVRVPLDDISSDDSGSDELAGKNTLPIGVLIRPDGKRAYVSNANANAISIIDLKLWKLIGSLHAGKEPDGMGYSSLTVKQIK